MAIAASHRCKDKQELAYRSLSILMYLTLSLMLIMLGAWLYGVREVMTGSVPMGWWWVHPALPHRGDYIEACLPLRIVLLGKARVAFPQGYCPGGIAPAMKRLIAAPGDVVLLTPQGIAVNDVLVQHSAPLHRDSLGGEIPRQLAYGRYAVTRGYWILGDSPKSWDSRYYGPIPSENVLGVGTPLLVHT